MIALDIAVTSTISVADMSDWSIQEIAKLVGTTSRTLRHYDALGLLRPTAIGRNGYRRYDAAALVRLQRILLLRELGLSLEQIADILERPTTVQDALARHVRWLEAERERRDRQIAAVRSTITALDKGEEPMAQTMFDGFDPTVHKEEVIQRWGEKAYGDAENWWTGLGVDGQADATARVAALNAAWVEAAEAGIDPAGGAAQDLAARHIAWLRSVPGTPAHTPGGNLDGYVRSLAEMYVGDPRFAANYGGESGAAFVRAALLAWLDAQ